MALTLRGVDLQASIHAICDELADLPEEDVVRVLRVVRWEANAALVPDPPKVDYPIDKTHRGSLRKVMDVLTRLA